MTSDFPSPADGPEAGQSQLELAGPIHWPKAAYGRGFRFGKPFPWLAALAWPHQAASHCKPSLTTMSTILKFCPSDLDSPCQVGLQKTVFSLVDL
jgi:hypothetical protein